ncbi:radical SAM protein [Patescibacteria group bacterium]|nr:radical SAM protein [Patescibacteria group bacterium]MCG2694515.1 radical SAM protein [Candidatus Parcubacteria bacterium]
MDDLIVLKDKDVIVINSPLFYEKKEEFDENVLPPIGLGYILTNLKNNKISCYLVDAVYNNISVFDLASMINQSDAKFMAINIFSTNLFLVKDLIEKIEKEITIIIGGLATKYLYQEIFSWKTENEIIAVIGDGELILVDIVKDKLQEEPIYEKTHRKLYEVNSKSIYFVKNISNISLNRDFFKNEPLFSKKFGVYEANIVTSRGCIYNCAFCGASRELNKKIPIRIQSLESIQFEIDGICKKYSQISSVRILDDLFIRNQSNIAKIEKIFTHRDVFWRSMAHILSFTKMTNGDLAKIKASGCLELSIGIESGSENVLKKVGKCSDLNLIKRTITDLMKAQINLKTYFIFGFPGETKEDMKKTYDLICFFTKEAKKLKTGFRVSVFQFRPYHGTKFYFDLFGKKRQPFDLHLIEDNSLSARIKRIQFNFTAGNFSNCRQETVSTYIKKSLALNNS